MCVADYKAMSDVTPSHIIGASGPGTRPPPTGEAVRLERMPRARAAHPDISLYPALLSIGKSGAAGDTFLAIEMHLQKPPQ